VLYLFTKERTKRARCYGKRQVTYNGHPLYYYVTDDQPGEITCQDVFEFGGKWLLVQPGGRPERST
jgi:predicted lipoprotein with Yx(FWY)xxD motif